MLVSPKWQTMWMESQHCSKSLVNVSLPSQQAKKILEDLRTSCCSSNKPVQLEALKCWGTWINNQNPDDWKLNTVCYTAVRPLLTNKLQPHHRDVDVCKLKLSLLWALLVKVQNMMQLEGPQYILEVFLQSCLTWLSSTGGEGVDSEISVLIYQLLLGIFKIDENAVVCDTEMFPPLKTDIFQLKKVFHHLADKFLKVFVYWRKVQDKSLIIKIWNHFLEHCEQSCEYVPIPVWHKVFKLAGQICSERNEPVKDRLAFLHGSATNLKTVLLSSKFIDYGNLLTTPCEALLRKLVELCTTECEEFCDPEMFHHSREISQVLSEESAAVGGYDLCVFLLDALEEFSLRSLYWGVWCGLVHCYKARLMGVHPSRYTRLEMKFYRKLRGVAVNFDLDRELLREDCARVVQAHMDLLNLTHLGSGCPPAEKTTAQAVVPVVPGRFSASRKQIPGRPHAKTITFNFDLIKDIFKVLDPRTTKSLLDGLFTIRFLAPNGVGRDETAPENVSLHLKVSVDSANEVNLTVSCVPEKVTTPVKKAAVVPYRPERNDESETVSTPKTRSKSRAEEEEMKKEMASQRRKKRKSFEVLVQEIVQKNKLRKTEKNSTRRKSPVSLTRKEKRTKRKDGEKEKAKAEVSERKPKKTKKEDPKNQKKAAATKKNDGKLENYFKVITRKAGSEAKREHQKTKKEKKNEEKKKKKKKKKKKGEEASCCTDEETDKKGETSWRQTSLKTMMNGSKKEKAKHGMKTRNNASKQKTERKKPVDGKEIAKLSRFKEVFHDHEYTKIELPDLRALERVLADGNKGKPKGEETKEEAEKPEPEPEPKTNGEDEDEEKATTEEEPPKTEPEEEFSEAETNLERRGKKRVRILDSLKPSKKMKPSPEEEEPPEEKPLPLEVIEKENLESLPEEKCLDFVSPTKEGERTAGTPVPKGSPKVMNGSISSRALRMIALLPESTKAGQVHWDAQPKGEVLKCKKAPNVDKNSRASKMLALLSENPAKPTSDAEELTPRKEEEAASNGGLPTTPTSTLKSPKSIKKRRSIRFDDAKNETVLYQTDMPPSQILMEKEKCRRMQGQEVTSALP